MSQALLVQSACSAQDPSTQSSITGFSGHSSPLSSTSSPATSLALPRAYSAPQCMFFILPPLPVLTISTFTDTPKHAQRNVFSPSVSPVPSHLRSLSFPCLSPSLRYPISISLTKPISSATPFGYSTWAMAGLTFNWYIRRRWSGWWHTYNYVTAAALDSGLIMATVIIFFAITLPNVEIPQWWGNVGVYDTVVRS